MELKMLKNLENFFLSNLQEDDIGVYLKARTFMFFGLIISVVIFILFIALNVIIQRDLFSMLNIMLFVILSVSLGSLVALKSGRYYLAVLLLLAPSMGGYALYMLSGNYAFDEAAIFSPYHLMIFILFSALFANWQGTLAVTILAIGTSITSLLITDRINPEVIPVILINMTFGMIVIGIISILIHRVNGQARKRLEEELENRQEYERTLQFIDSIESISERLRESSQSMSDTSASFSENAQNQAASTEEVSATVEEISAVSERVDNSTSLQKTAVQDLVSRLQQLKDTTSEMKERVESSRGRSGDVSEITRQGSASMEEMNGRMKSISDRSNEMTGIISIINDISDQINLLSLNASIEAARAGEQGRGFAVVADEISKLADQTSQSVRSIADLIKASDEEVTSGNRIVQESVEANRKIMAGVQQIRQEVESLARAMQRQDEVTVEVIRLGQDVNVRSEEISTATGEQKNAAQEIVRTISDISELTQENASGAEQMAGSAESLATIAADLDHRLDEFQAGIQERRGIDGGTGEQA
jgi:methyl-accepting chemotaxis protein